MILPGSKTTIADLLAIQNTGLAQEICTYAAAGGTVMGICGGFQMLGQSIIDTEGVEGHEGRFPALDLLPLRTYFGEHKVTRQRQVTSKYPQDGLPIHGYELHQGYSKVLSETSPSAMALFDESSLGLVSTNQAIWGTYLHGIFDNGPWRGAWLNRLRQQRGLKALPTGIANYRTERDAMLDHLADVVTEHLDLSPILNQF